jgi:TRAP-type mannitol/chloroaromatic compound transport system substrate-binding protein
MKRREFLKNAGLGAAAGTTLLAAQAKAQTGALPTVNWRLAASWPKSLDTLYGGADLIGKRVAAATGGKFNIKVFAAGEIVGGLQVLDAVQNGTVECGHTATYYYFGKDPTFAFSCAIPFGMNCRQQNAWMYHGGGLELMREFFKEYNIIQFPAGNTGCQMGGWFRKPINKVSDLKGLKMRIGGTGGLPLTKLGVVPQQIAGGDIYPALEKGTVDAAEWVGPYDDEKLGFAKVAKYYYYPGWWEGCGQAHNITNLAKWNTLPKAYQSAIQTASADSWNWTLAKYDAVNPPALKRLLAGGALLRAFPQEVLEVCYKTATDHYADLSKSNPMFKKLYDSLVPFRGDSYLWQQVAEMGFDTFMVRMRTRT